MKIRSKVNNLSQNQNVRVFVETAEKYCYFIENHRTIKTYKLLCQLVDILVTLYKYALKLPDVEMIKNHHYLEHVSDKQYTMICKRWFMGINKHKYYWMVFKPFVDNAKVKNEIVRSAIFDDLADIYRDLKNGLIEYRKGSVKNMTDAVWHWRWHFYNHWGDHLVDLLKPLKEILNKKIF